MYSFIAKKLQVYGTCVLGVCWVVPKSTKDLLYSWKEIGRRESNEDWWELIPASFGGPYGKKGTEDALWRRETTSRKLESIVFYLFWCKQYMMGGNRTFC